MNPTNPYQFQPPQQPAQPQPQQPRMNPDQFLRQARQTVDQQFVQRPIAYRQPGQPQMQGQQQMQPQYQQPTMQQSQFNYQQTQAPQQQVPMQQLFNPMPQAAATMQQFAQQPMNNEQAAMAQIMSTPIEVRKRSLKMPIIITASVLVFVLVVGGAIAIISSSGNKKSVNNNNPLTTPAAKVETTPAPDTAASTPASSLYESPDKLFTIQFSKTPTVDAAKVNVDGTDVPYSIYTDSNDTSTKNYFIATWDYTAHPISADKINISTAMDSIIESLAGKEISDKTSASIGSTSGSQASFKTPVGDNNLDSYLRVVLKDKKMFAVFSIGCSQEEFNKFISSMTIN